MGGAADPAFTSQGLALNTPRKLQASAGPATSRIYRHGTAFTLPRPPLSATLCPGPQFGRKTPEFLMGVLGKGTGRGFGDEGGGVCWSEAERGHGVEAVGRGQGRAPCEPFPAPPPPYPSPASQEPAPAQRGFRGPPPQPRLTMSEKPWLARTTTDTACRKERVGRRPPRAPQPPPEPPPRLPPEPAGGTLSAGNWTTAPAHGVRFWLQLAAASKSVVGTQSL